MLFYNSQVTTQVLLHTYLSVYFRKQFLYGVIYVDRIFVRKKNTKTKNTRRIQTF